MRLLLVASLLVCELLAAVESASHGPHGAFVLRTHARLEVRLSTVQHRERPTTPATSPLRGLLPRLETQQANLELLQQRLASLEARQRSLAASERRLEERAVAPELSASPGPAPMPAEVEEDLPCTDLSGPCGMMIQVCTAVWIFTGLFWLVSMEDRAAVLGVKDPTSGDGLRPWVMAWAGLLVVGAICLGLAVVLADVLGMASAAFLMVLTLFCLVFVGDDPFLTKALKGQVDVIEKENRRLKEMHSRLEVKLEELTSVSKEMEHLQGKLRNEDGEELKNIMYILHTSFALETVTAVVQMFYSHDLDQSGHISGRAESGFVSNMKLLWQMVPDPELQARFKRHVEHHGLTLYDLTLLTDAMIKGDSVACRAELERQMGAKAGADAANSQAAQSPPVAPATDATLTDSLSAGSPGNQPAVLEGDGHYEELRASPPEKLAADAPRPAPPAPGGGARRPSPMRCMLQWVLVTTAILASTLFMVALLINNTAAMVCSGAALVIAIGLNVFLDLLDNLVMLRKEVGELRATKAKLEADARRLEANVRDLQRLQVGMKEFKQKFGENVNEARSYVVKHDSVVKMSIASTLFNIFKDITTRNGTKQIDPSKVDEFCSKVTAVFKGREGFDFETVEENIRKYRSEGIDAGTLYKIARMDQPVAA